MALRCKETFGSMSSTVTEHDITRTCSFNKSNKAGRVSNHIIICGCLNSFQRFCLVHCKIGHS